MNRAELIGRTVCALHRDAVAPEGVANLFDCRIEVGFASVELVDYERSGKSVIGGRLPRLQRANFQTCSSGNYDQRSVCYAHRGKHIATEIGITGSVQYIDLVICPLAGHHGHLDARTSRLLLGLVIQHASLIVYSALTVRRTSCVVHRIRERSLARPAVGGEDYVPYSIS